MELTSAEEADMKESCRVDGTQVAMMKCLQIWKPRDPSIHEQLTELYWISY